MATLRSRKYLSCFYCGKRSKLRFEGQKSFDCTNCDATNWLDEHGDITDPPSTTSSVERTQIQFAIPRAAVRSPTRSMSPDGVGSEESVFCDACLRNQHMLTSSLAQFEWPEDQSGPEYLAREKKYWALRKDLEKRYPQMCAECEPKVEKKLHEASYTAQTDHLRRMMDRTRSQRKDVKKRDILDIFDYAGKWSWYLGFILQIAWHVAVIWPVFAQQYTLGGTDSWIATALKNVQQIGDIWLPPADRLMKWAINSGLCSLPWNPRFKQTIRGFTAHYLGFKQWYTYQLLILLVRYVGLSMAQYSSQKGLYVSAQLGAQIAIVIITAYIYHASGKSIRTDTSPLFRRPEMKRSPKPTTRSRSPNDQNDLGSILDEISRGSNTSHPAIEDSELFSGSSGLHENQLTESRLGSLRLSEPAEPAVVEKPAPRIVHYESEMDWTPSASQHRAFSSYNPYRVKNTNPRFSDAPLEPKPGPIWYKVPPAPTNPAQRLRNPPMRPIIRESPKEKKENFFQSSTRGPLDIGSSTQGKGLSDVNFAEPKFFAPEDKNDPRDNLSRMFANSFSISPSPDEDAFRGSRRTVTNSIFKTSQGTAGKQKYRTPRLAELFVLAGALYAWISALGTSDQYGPSLALASVIACLIVSIRLAADLQYEVQMREGKQPSIFTPSLANLGFAQVISSLVLAWNIWSYNGTDIPCHTYGSVHFATVIIHHMWHTFV
ncbi:Ima1 N-terminal domain-containing protein [Hypoxylon trugodes]|uniref:Ima1 N-terminal domain-containing protein n=1 Tax=Hypoxylon trugodes TaxID=326681 RepID=UPI0021965AD1|nr:Ima1 N-terminal domain-containing protein [Hypoxylon trugodes]KAI1388219.1 Ima1 N-terminal domain-containing protein [Hypoxylon trugodes]